MNMHPASSSGSGEYAQLHRLQEGERGVSEINPGNIESMFSQFEGRTSDHVHAGNTLDLGLIFPPHAACVAEPRYNIPWGSRALELTYF